MKNLLTTITAIIIVTIVPIKSYAETDFYVESDPFAFALNGHSIHVGLEDDHFRFQVGMFGATLPDSFKDNDKFDIEQSGYGVKLDYFTNKQGGAFIGLEYGMTEIDFEHGTTSVREQRNANLLGVRVGYKYRINDTFYVMPWVGIDRNLSDTSTVTLSDDSYNQDKWFIFPTVHWECNFNLQDYVNDKLT